MAETRASGDDKKRPPSRRPYAAPRLVRYGDAVSLTENRFFGGKNDKGSGFKTRTN